MRVAGLRVDSLDCGEEVCLVPVRGDVSGDAVSCLLREVVDEVFVAHREHAQSLCHGSAVFWPGFGVGEGVAELDHAGDIVFVVIFEGDGWALSFLH